MDTGGTGKANESRALESCLGFQVDDEEMCLGHRLYQDEIYDLRVNSRNNNDDETKRMEDLRGKGGGRLKHRTIDGDVPLCLRKTEKESNDDSSSKGKKREENESGSSTLNKMKHRDMNKMASGSKDMFKDSTGKRDDGTKNKEVTFIKLQKNIRSTHSSERIEKLYEGWKQENLTVNTESELC